ncbi:PaaI family thioesterase [Nocardia jiangxiensis]|uniref:PaaI family thioesterase n=1 Tax=Nocardia jiangxiensis TaxID=282685 RepID=UPI0002D2E3BD|nr:PaaI family thioesterase [Nocardia jiangxiensis]
MSEHPDDFTIEPSASGRLLCGGCSGNDRCRLGVEAREDPLRFDVICPRHWQGGPEVAHGGWIAAVFDDVLTMAVLRTERRLVTKSLAVSYQRPVPVEQCLAATASIDAHSGRNWTVSAVLALGRDGPTLATARAELRTRRADHYARHHAWLTSN